MFPPGPRQQQQRYLLDLEKNKTGGLAVNIAEHVGEVQP